MRNTKLRSTLWIGESESRMLLIFLRYNGPSQIKR
jgi:hypothetical protein